MKRNKKKLLSLVLSLIMIITALPIAGTTAFAETSGDYNYEILSEEDKTCMITDYNGDASELTIPSQIDGYTVTEIGINAFYECNSLKSITIPDSIITIDDIFGSWCKSLTNIEVSENNPNYSSENGLLFNKEKTELIRCPEGKTSVSDILPDSIESIGPDAFYSCAITSINIPNSVTKINYSAFSGCTSLKNVNIPNSVSEIGSSAFYYCNSLTNITVPDSVTFIGSAAFSECTSLTSVTISNSITEIDDYTFNRCISLSSVTIPDSVSRIGKEAFGDCYSLTDINISDNVKEIGEKAFFGCDITSVTIPGSVTHIGKCAFGYKINENMVFHDKVEDFVIYGYKGSQAEWYAKDYGFNFVSLGHVSGLTYEVLSEKDKTCTITGYVGTANEFIIPWFIDGYSIRAVSDKAFYNCDTLTSIALLEDVSSVGELAFANCDSLKDAYIPETVVSIGYKAFGYRDNGTSKVDGFTIHGKTGSVAEMYAKENGFKFVSTGHVRFGDVNCNYEITIADAKLVLQSVANIKTLSIEQKLRADLNGDGAVTIVDAKWILQIVAGLRDEETLKLK